MRTRLVALLALVALLGPACGDSDEGSAPQTAGSTGAPAAGGAVTVPVSVDAKPDGFSASSSPTPRAC